MTDRDYGINMLRLWWNATPMAQLGFSSFSDAIGHYDGINPDFISGFGNALRGAQVDKVKAGMEALAAQSGTGYPKYSEFFDYAAKYVGTLSMSDVGAAVQDSAKQVGALALSGFALYAVGALAFFFLVVRRK